MIRILSIAALLFALVAPARAEIRFYAEPAYKSLDPDAPSPMEDMIALAEEGDARAQYILGDMYTKGKGGLGKDVAKGMSWFETSAQNGAYESFIRLAALAKKRKDFTEAYKWYTLAIDLMGNSRMYKDWRAHALESRKTLKDSGEPGKDDIKQALKDVSLWKDEMRRARRERQKQARLAAQEEKKPVKRKQSHGEN